MEDIQISRLKTLVGKRANATVKSLSSIQEIDFTILKVRPPTRPCENFNQAVNLSDFDVELDDGTLVDVDGGGAKSKITLPGSKIYWQPHDLTEASWLAEI
jgi:hypothetical protein